MPAGALHCFPFACALRRLSANCSSVLSLCFASNVSLVRCCSLWAQESQVQMNAHFHAVHLFAVMTKLLPEWLPRTLFDLLHRQWNSPERRARSARYKT